MESGSTTVRNLGLLIAGLIAPAARDLAQLGRPSPSRHGTAESIE